MKNKAFLLILVVIILGSINECLASHKNCSELRGRKNFFTGYEAANPDGTVNAVIEISSGDNEKCEVKEADGIMKCDRENGKPRIVKYLGYPTNYGMVPKTILPKEKGGDGDPLDILVIGRQLKRGQVIKVKVIGTLKMKDRGERDDKLIAVLPGTHFDGIKNINELNQKFPGVSSIIEVWFMNYKGSGKIQTEGFGSVEDAGSLLNNAREDYNMIKR